MDQIKLLFSGDFIPPDTKKKIFSEDLLNILKNKDYSIANLESPLTNSTEQILKTGNNFKSNPDSIKLLKEGFFDAVALSNNHIRDFGNSGVLDTLENCNKNNIATVGAGVNLYEAGKPLVLSIKKKTIVILNYSEHEFNIASNSQAGANPFSPINAFYEIRKLKEENDFVIVIYHGGLEYQYYPTLEMVKNFKFMIEVGADCILAHHTHRYSGVIQHQNKPILFGLGNFLSPTKSKNNSEWRKGLIANIMLQNGLVKYELIPTIISEDYRTVNVLKGSEREKALYHISQLSDLISDDTKLSHYWNLESIRATKRVIQMLKSKSHLEYRIRKYLPLLSSTRLSKYQKLNLLNFIRCSSHRELLISILEDMYSSKT